MPVQWTAHIPQAMQRHGGSIKPEAEAECDEAMSSFLQGLAAAGAAARGLTVARTRRARPAARPSSP